VNRDLRTASTVIGLPLKKEPAIPQLWCAKHNSMQELAKKDPYKEHNFAMVPCIGPTCERWNNNKCGAMFRGWTK
jgi:hypothetical protein